MYNFVLFDIDGVIIRPQEYYSEYLEHNGYPGAFSSIEAFYKQDLQCITGEKNPLEDIEEYLKKFKWDYDAERYFIEQYKYESSYIDFGLLQRINLLREKDIRCYLATDQNKHRKEYILNEWNFKNYFDGYFISSDIGYRKINHEFWEHVISDFACYNITVNGNALFIDDRIENLEKSREYGFDVFHVNRRESIIELYELLERMV